MVYKYKDSKSGDMCALKEICFEEVLINHQWMDIPKILQVRPYAITCLTNKVALLIYSGSRTLNSCHSPKCDCHFWFKHNWPELKRNSCRELRTS